MNKVGEFICMAMAHLFFVAGLWAGETNVLIAAVFLMLNALHWQQEGKCD